MIEIVFSDSACGGLKMAQSYGRGDYNGGGIGVFISHEDGREPTAEELEKELHKAEKQHRLAWESAVPLGGSPADVFGFNLVLSAGDISEKQPGPLRLQTLDRLYSIYPADTGRQVARELLNRANENMEVVCDRAATGEDFRIWYSNKPDEICGLYWFLAQLEALEERIGQVYLVKLPEWEEEEDGSIVEFNGWGEMDPSRYHKYLPYMRPAPPVFRRVCAAHWRTLQRENAPLRAMLNGQLVSSSETLYDDFIIREIAVAEEEFQEAMIIGRVLGRYRLGIGDAWVAYRIEEMILAGKLEAVTEGVTNSPGYHRILRKRA